MICPEGEILNIYPLNKDYMLMTDEVKSSDAVMNRFGLADEGHRYVNVVYLYEISTAKKYPVTDPRFYSRSEDWPVIRSDDGPVWICGYYDQEEVRDFGGSALFYIAVDRLIEDIKGCGRVQLIPVLAAGEDSSCTSYWCWKPPGDFKAALWFPKDGADFFLGWSLPYARRCL